MRGKSQCMPALYIAALFAQSQEIPLGEAAVGSTVLGQVGTGLQGGLSRHGISRKRWL